jgi:hypothetical protein
MQLQLSRSRVREESSQSLVAERPEGAAPTLVGLRLFAATVGRHLPTVRGQRAPVDDIEAQSEKQPLLAEAPALLRALEEPKARVVNEKVQFDEVAAVTRPLRERICASRAKLSAASMAVGATVGSSVAVSVEGIVGLAIRFPGEPVFHTEFTAITLGAAAFGAVYFALLSNLTFYEPSEAPAHPSLNEEI